MAFQNEFDDKSDKEILEFFDDLLKTRAAYHELGLMVQRKEEIYKLLKFRIEKIYANMNNEIAEKEKKINQLYHEIEELKKEKNK